MGDPSCPSEEGYHDRVNRHNRYEHAQYQDRDDDHIRHRSPRGPVYYHALFVFRVFCSSSLLPS